MASEYETLLVELHSIGDKIDNDFVRMGQRSFTWTGDPNNNEQIDLIIRYNKILEKMRLLEESQSGGRYRKKRRNSRKQPRTKKHRKSKKAFFGLF